jgi:hypothetical protein
MKRVPWAERRTGDIFLAAVPGFPHPQIWDAERVLHPDAPTDFQATHCGLMGFPDQHGGTVVEAWLDKHEDSVACINPAAKYAGYESYMELWRPAAFEPDGLKLYIAIYGPEAYGWLNLAGFEWIAFVKAITGRDVQNPVEVSQVCSQGVGDYMTLEANLGVVEMEWIRDVDIRNLDPLALRMGLLAHES